MQRRPSRPCAPFLAVRAVERLHQAGWFGDIEPTSRTNFDPTTGLTDPAAAVAPATAATYAGVLYSIARGDKARVATLTSAPFDGVIK